ncbi:MAG: prepilin-type N-terminal cleavage/methylation domain-containing protein [Kiritimatiellia bacterium]
MIRAKHRRGFTLVEVVIACAIFSIGLAGIYGLMAWLVRANSFSNRMTEATAMAQAKMEELNGGQWATIISGSDIVGAFTRTWTVTSLSADLKNVHLVVNWEDVDGKNHQITLDCMKSL